MDSLMPIGNYNGRITGHDITQLGDRKTPCVVIDVEIISGKDFEKNEVECAGVARRVIYWLTEKAMQYSVKSIRDLGYTGESLKGLALENEDSSGLVGEPVRLSIKHAEDHKGVLRERLGLYPAKKQLQKMEESALEKFEKLFKREQQKLLLQEEEHAQTDEEGEVAETEDEEITAPTPPPAKTKKVGTGFQSSAAKKPVRTPF